MKLSVQGLNSYYGPAHILFDVGLEVGAGEVVALLGRNGAGKSTTFRSIVGLVEQREGRVVFEGGMCPASRPTSSCAAGSAMFRRSTASSPTLRWKKISK